MDKSQAVTELKKQGFASSLENGVVMIEVGSEAERTRANRAVKKLNLCGSWGTRGARNDSFGRYEEPDKQA